jgi:hypothetical protein
VLCQHSVCHAFVVGLACCVFACDTQLLTGGVVTVSYTFRGLSILGTPSLHSAPACVIMMPAASLPGANCTEGSIVVWELHDHVGLKRLQEDVAAGAITQIWLQKS